MAEQQATQSPGRKVMICVDGSAQAEKAFDWFAENVYHKGDDILVVIAPELHPPALPHALASEDWHRQVEEHQKKVNDVLQKYKQKVLEKCPESSHAKVEAISVSYSIGNALCEEAKKNKVSMIVLGSRGMGLVRRTLLGSVSDYVIHHAHCPVVVVPKQH